MRLPRTKTAIIATALTLLVHVACGDSSGPEGENQDFSGSYTLVSYSIGSAASVNEVPGATGSFTMTATTYEVTTTISVGGVPEVTTDEGTYTATGTATSGSFSQQSTVTNDLQFQGTYSWDASTNRLTIDTTSQSIRHVLVLQRI